MRKVRWGVLGTADIARGQTIPGLQLAEHCELYAIAGRKLEKAKSYQEEFGFRKAYGSYDELLADPEVEAVYIPLPNDLHCEWTIRALKAKKHVLCEKPLAVSETQVQEMFRTAEENGVLLMEAFAYLHSPFVKAVKAELDAGTIGEIRYLESAFITGRRPDTDIRLRKETYGGALYDLGCYAVSMAMWMLGKEPDTVRAAAQFSDYPRAFMLLNQIHQMAPGNLPAHMYHARLLEARGDLEAAFRRWHQLLGLVPKDSPERAEIMQAGRRLQQRLRMQRDVSGHAGVDPETLPRAVRIEDPTMQKMPADSEIAEMRILRGRLESGGEGSLPDAPLRLYVTFYDQEPGGRIVPTRALVSPSPLMLAASGANSSGAIPFEATYIVPAVHREGTQELMPHTSIYHGYTLHLFAGDTLQDAFARPQRLLELPIHVAAPGGGG